MNASFFAIGVEKLRHPGSAGPGCLFFAGGWAGSCIEMSAFSSLAQAFALAGSRNPSGDARCMYRAMRQPGAEGLEAATEAAHSTTIYEWSRREHVGAIPAGAQTSLRSADYGEHAAA
jgi:hypothetical protein